MFPLALSVTQLLILFKQSHSFTFSQHSWHQLSWAGRRLEAKSALWGYFRMTKVEQSVLRYFLLNCQVCGKMCRRAEAAHANCCGLLSNLGVTGGSEQELSNNLLACSGDKGPISASTIHHPRPCKSKCSLNRPTRTWVLTGSKHFQDSLHLSTRVAAAAARREASSAPDPPAELLRLFYVFLRVFRIDAKSSSVKHQRFQSCVLGRPNKLLWDVHPEKGGIASGGATHGVLCEYLGCFYKQTREGVTLDYWRKPHQGRGDGNRTEMCPGSITAGVEGEEEEKSALAVYRNNLPSV